ncbi:MAG TPA: dihydrodipicolinate reductase [Sphingobium sp.]|nr:dihydrodipicolinate reductase [Sphingobium sp.]
MKYRVVHCGTGYVGKIALRLMLQQPHLELVGHHVHSPEKAGKDTGEFLDGNPTTGVITTNNWDAVIARKPDVLTYFFDSVRREREAIEDLIQFLEAGINVVCLSAWGVGHRKTVPPDLMARIDAACKKGNSSLFFNGCDPGWATSDLAIAALAPANRIDCIRMIEFASFANYTAEYASREYFGFGKPPGFKPILAQGGLIEEMWSPTLHRVADALGVELDEFRAVYETDSVDYDINPAFGKVEAGTASVVHFELQGLCKGRPVVVLEHLDHLFKDVGEYKNNKWTRPGTPGTSYRIEVEGSPSYALEVHSHSSDFNVTPVLNCIPSLVAAPPGLLGPLDLPRYWSRNVTAKLGPWP